MVAGRERQQAAQGDIHLGPPVRPHEADRTTTSPRCPSLYFSGPHTVSNDLRASRLFRVGVGRGEQGEGIGGRGGGKVEALGVGLFLTTLQWLG